MPHFQLAQLNIATLLEPLESPRLADFVANLDRINKLAEQSPGFVWRLMDENGDATAIRPFGKDVVVNMSVWASMASLHAFAFRSVHVEMLRRRREWFDRMPNAYAVLWWVPRNHRPDMQEASQRLASLRAHGPTAYAFTFRDSSAAPDTTDANNVSVAGC
jgi:hypothetical protein